MDVKLGSDEKVAGIAAAIGDPTRARMLYTLMDGRARTSSELAMATELSPSTASAHLNRLKEERLVKASAQGRHRYYRLEGPDVASALEALSVLVGGHRHEFVPTTPRKLLGARTCYDHLAGALGVALHDQFIALGWLSGSYEVTPVGAKALENLGVDLDATRALRRRFAYACLDWSERRPHLGGSLAATVLNMALKRDWVRRDLESRAVTVTEEGRGELLLRLGIKCQ